MQFPTDTFTKFAKQYRIPDYVKSASTKDFEGITDPHSKAECYFAKFASLASESATPSNKELLKRASILDIDEDIRALETNFAQFVRPAAVKTAAPAEKYPVRNKREFMAAQDWLKKNAYTIALHDRRELAEKLVKKADEFGLTVDDMLVKFAGQGFGDVRHIIPNLLKRAELIRRSTINTAPMRQKASETLEALAEAAKLQPNQTVQVENLDKIAAALQFYDNEYALYPHYANAYIDSPDEVTFVHDEKTAQEIEKYACRLGNDVFDIREFETLKVADIVDTFGENFVMAMSDGLALSHEKFAEVLDVMTEVEKALFTDLVKISNIQPKYRQQERISLQELAKLYS